MRVFIAAGLMGAAVVSLAACSKPAPGGNAAAGAPDASASAGAAGPLTPDQFPHRKPGLWSRVMGMDGPASGPGTKLCVDDASEAKMNAFALQKLPGGGHCDVHVTRNIDGSLSMNSTCDMGQYGKATSTGTVKGDFNSSFTEASTSTITSSMPAMNGNHTMTAVNTWLGPCPPGMKGGDMTMADGTTRNILDDEASRAGAASNAAGN